MECEEREKRNKAYLALAKARQEGLVQRKPCESCGEPKSQAHHDDYDKPLEIRWLCVACHHKWHNQYGRGTKMTAPENRDVPFKCSTEISPEIIKRRNLAIMRGHFTDEQLVDWRKSHGWSQEKAAKRLLLSLDGYRKKEQGRASVNKRDMVMIELADQEEASKATV